MPHVTIEYSANVADHHDIDALVGAVHQAALDNGLPSADALRTRAVAQAHYRVADGQPDHAFIAMTARVGPGRASDKKSGFIEQLLDAARTQIAAEGGPLAVAWSIELTEIDAQFRINDNGVRSRLDSQRNEGR